MNRIERLRKKINENPEGALAILDMMNQVYLRETVIEICNDDNLSPVEKADRVLIYLDVPMDKVLEEVEIKALQQLRAEISGQLAKQTGGKGMTITLKQYSNNLASRIYAQVIRPKEARIRELEAENERITSAYKALITKLNQEDSETNISP